MQAALIEQLQQILNKELREVIIKQVLGARNEIEQEQRVVLEKKINASLEIKGFREPIKAPPAILTRELVKVSAKNQDVLDGILCAWLALLSEKADIAKELLEEQIQKIKEREPDSKNMEILQVMENVVKPVAKQLEDSTSLTEKEVKVLTLTLYNILMHNNMETEGEEHVSEDVSSQASSELNVPELSKYWKKILDELESLPEDAPEWDQMQVENFIILLQKLSSQKAKLAAQLQEKYALEDVLEKIHQEYTEELSFFGMGKAMHWTAGKVPADSIKQVTNSLLSLTEYFQKYRLLQQLTASNINEARENRRKIAELEQEIEDLYSSIDHLLNSSEAQVSGMALAVEEVSPTASVEKKEGEDKSGHLKTGSNQFEGEVSNNTVGTDSDQEPLEAVIPEPSSDMEAKAAEQQEGLEDFKGSPVSGKDYHASHEQNKIAVSAVHVEHDQKSSTDWNRVCFDFIDKNDLAGVYWLCRSLALQGVPPPVNEWLIKALQGATWLEKEFSTLVNDLSKITKNNQPGRSDIEELLGLAASLRTSIVAPLSGMLVWLRTPSCCPDLNELVNTIKEFAQLGKPLRSIYLHHVDGIQQYFDEIKDISNEAKKWLDEAPRRRIKIPRATSVWQDLVSRNGELRSIIQAVAENQKDSFEEVKQKARQWIDRAFLENVINEVDRKVVGRKVRPITGAPREQIMRYVRDACKIALRWCELVERDKEVSTKGYDWFVEQVSKLRSGIQSSLPKVRFALKQLAQDKDEPYRAIAARCINRSFEQLCADLGINEGVMDISEADLPTAIWFMEDTEEMEIALARRLILLPEVQLEDSGLPTKEAELFIASALYNQWKEQKPNRQIFEEWLRKKDFRFLQFFLTFEKDENERAELARRYEEEIVGSRAALQDLLQQSENDIEQAIVNGIFSHEDRAEHLSKLQDIDPLSTLNFAAQYEKIAEVQQAIAEKRRRKLEELHLEWQELHQRLNSHPGDKYIKEEIHRSVVDALEVQNTRAVEECIAQLSERMNQGKPIDENPFVPFSEKESKDVLKRFLDLTGPLGEKLEKQGLQSIQSALKDGKNWAGLNFSKYPRALQEDTLAGLEAWRRLKQGSARSDHNSMLIKSILNYLGFNIDPSLKKIINLQKKGENWVYIRANVSAGGRSPVPQFGSQQQGVYDIVCLWERPSVDTLGGWMRDLYLESKNILVIYLGRMSLRHRNIIRQLAGERGLAMVVLDEILFCFLAGERLERLQVFFRCALPFSAVNPYTPFKAGDVSPEMFFGRKDMAREIQRAEGSCIVYGGRQLGKSALLRHVQREFHNPEREQYAYVEDIKLIGSPMSDQRPDVIWLKLRDIFKKYGLISANTRTEQPEKISELIEDALQKKPHARVLILFDEADNFIDADSENYFHNIDGLRILMSKIQRRLKVVFAGLHNVQRFQTRGNHPLAHYGAPLCVGPLEPEAAQQLIIQPLHTLGYRFADNSLVLSILSYTNYHPGLIQLFCHELLNSFVIRSGDIPPFEITREAVESIYRNTEVRARICERFDWTLALDTRYQAIAWAMIYDQADAKNGFSRTYSAEELLYLAKEWWPRGFEETKRDHLHGLLEEMCGLGVLVRDAQGNYRLRSPNLVRLIEDVEGRLLDLLEKDPEIKGFDPDSYHVLLEEGFYSPLTYAQESLLNQQRFGAALVFASKANGLEYLTEALKRIVPEQPDQGNKTAFRILPAEIKNGNQFEKWLEKYLKDHEIFERLYVCCNLPDNGREQVSLIEASLNLIKRYEKRQRQFLRIFFILDPYASWLWFLQPGETRSSLERKMDAVIALRRWNQRAIRQRLAQQEKLHSENVCREIMRVTGGWAYLLDEMFKRSSASSEDDVRPYLEILENELSNSDTAIFQDFWCSLGLGHNVNDKVFQMLNFIFQVKEIPKELTEPKEFIELMGCENIISLQECKAGLLYLTHMGLVEDNEDALCIEPITRKMLEKQQ